MGAFQSVLQAAGKKTKYITKRQQHHATGHEIKPAQRRKTQQLRQTSMPPSASLLKFQSQQNCSAVNDVAWPHAVLKGANIHMDAKPGPLETISYRPCSVVHNSHRTEVKFRQEKGTGTLSVGDGCVYATGPAISMTTQGVLLPVWKHPPKCIADWKIGIVQVLQEGSYCKGYYGLTVNESEYVIEDYFSKTGTQTDKMSNDLPLLDRMTDDDHIQRQTLDRFDPAYCFKCSSPALLQQVYNGETVYFQLTMEDQPQTAKLDFDFQPPDKPRGPKCYLNRIEKRCHFRTMLCVYKPGLNSRSVYPLYAVDWYFNFTANRDKTQLEKFIYKPTEISSAPLKASSLNQNMFAPFQFKCMQKAQCVKKRHTECLETTFESPNNAQQWRGFKLKKPQKVYTLETSV